MLAPFPALHGSWMLSDPRDLQSRTSAQSSGDRGIVGELPDEIERVADAHDITLTAMRETASATHRELRDFRTDLATTEALADGMDVILTGSFARGDASPDSDCDFLVLVSGVPEHQFITDLLAEMRRLIRERQINEPGTQGVFGDFVLTTELLARIGLESDTNTNTTRRLLLLFESISIGNDHVRQQAIEDVLHRYCYDYHPAVRSPNTSFTVPRFLLNDLARYWRTVCVDFGAKQWRSGRQDWYLRYAKLITTRKILFAGSLMTVFLAASLPVRSGGDGYESLIQHFRKHSNMTPMARLLSSYDIAEARSQEALASVLRAYEDFAGLMLRRSSRTLLKSGNVADTADVRITQLRQQVEEIGAHVQSALEQIFFQDSSFEPLVRRYGLF